MSQFPADFASSERNTLAYIFLSLFLFVHEMLYVL